MHLYNAEVQSRVSFAQRQTAIDSLTNQTDDIWIHVLVGTSEGGYEIKQCYLDSEHIPGCTWQNYPALVKTLIGQSKPTHKKKKKVSKKGNQI